MKSKTILTAVLLLFVAMSVVAMVAKESRQASNSATTELPADGLVAIYFHGNVRCPTCLSIEALAHGAITERFADDLASGKLAWQVMNYELPENAHFVDEFQLAAPTVVLVQRQVGQTTESRNLDRVWELVGDQPAFAQYVEQEVQGMLASDVPADPQLSLKPIQGDR